MLGMTGVLPGREHNGYTEEEEGENKQTHTHTQFSTIKVHYLTQQLSINIIKAIETPARILTSSTTPSRIFSLVVFFFIITICFGNTEFVLLQHLLR